MKAAVLIKQLLGTSVVTKSRIGFLITLVTVVTISGEVVSTGLDYFIRNDTILGIGMGVVGFLSWLTGRLLEATKVESIPVRETGAGEVAAEHPLAFLGSLKYWGVILVLSASIISCLAAWRREKRFVVRARPLPVVAITVTNVVTITNSAPRLVFPSLRLQGVVVNGTKSSAVINGRVLWLGEAISNAVLVAVDAEHALVAMGGQTNVLALRK
jgi:hypothetical protein